SSTPKTNECPATQNATCASERSLPITFTSPVFMSNVPTRLARSTNQMRDPFVAMRCGFRPDGSDALYTPAPIAFAPSRTLAAGDDAATGDAFGDFAGSGDVAGDAVAEGELGAVGDASVVSAV